MIDQQCICLGWTDKPSRSSMRQLEEVRMRMKCHPPAQAQPANGVSIQLQVAGTGADKLYVNALHP